MPPVYDYACGACGRLFDVVKGIKDYDQDPTAQCSHCGHLCDSHDRDFSLCKFVFSGTSVQSAEYNPGLGQVVRNNYHKSEILKQKGLVEVGNDFSSGQKMQTHFEKRKKEELERRWRNELGEAET